MENTKHFLQEHMGQNDPICSALVNVSSLGNIEENPLSTAVVISTVSYLCFPSHCQWPFLWVVCLLVQVCLLGAINSAFS